MEEERMYNRIAINKFYMEENRKKIRRIKNGNGKTGIYYISKERWLTFKETLIEKTKEICGEKKTKI